MDQSYVYPPYYVWILWFNHVYTVVDCSIIQFKGDNVYIVILNTVKVRYEIGLII